MQKQGRPPRLICFVILYLQRIQIHPQVTVIHDCIIINHTISQDTAAYQIMIYSDAVLQIVPFVLVETMVHIIFFFAFCRKYSNDRNNNFNHLFEFELNKQIPTYYVEVMNILLWILIIIFLAIVHKFITGLNNTYVACIVLKKCKI